MNAFSNRRTMAAAPFLLLLLLLCFNAAPAVAQDNGAAASGETEQSAGNEGRRLLQSLALSPDQLLKIRMIREQNKEERRLAAERLRSAQRALDEAIYSNDASESVIEERARELAAAQAATVRLRAMTELSIRRILTPEQLNTLRGLRQRQAEQRRLERQMNLTPRRLRNRQMLNEDGQQPLPRDRFRQKDNSTEQQNDGTRPAATTTPRERRRAILRRARP